MLIISDGLTYYAKSNGTTVQQHLADVSEKAAEYASVFGMADAARIAGLLHDFGKYSHLFQGVLSGVEHGIDHALPGSYLSARMPHYIMESVAAHHSALLSKYELEPFLRTDCTLAPAGKMPALSGMDKYMAAINAFETDFGKGCVSMLSDQAGKDPDANCDHFEKMLRTRMLASCLVDADWTMSAAEEDGSPVVPDFVITEDMAGNALRRLEHMRADVSKRPCPERTRSMRDTVWLDCGRSGEQRGTWMSLTAPTGSGKTFGFLRFALLRCFADVSRRRIIIALPFLSLTDQVYGIVKELLPDSVLDVSTVDVDDANAREMASRWDAPCIVTTTVQLFDSLFSDQPGDLRKLHRLAGSALILDEVQALPDHIVQAAIRMLERLSDDYGVHVLLSTATQPSYELFKGIRRSPQEVISDVHSLFAMSPAEGIRVMDGERDVRDVADMALEYKDCCVVSNLKRHAQEIFDVWDQAGVDNLFLVSTALCPLHRQDVVSKIFALQAAGCPCHVSATQCIEAGVDLDFTQVLRAMAPLPSLIQAAGRQNRGRKRPRGEMLVFKLAPDGRKRLYPGAGYERLAVISYGLSLSGFDLALREALSEYDIRRFSKNPESRILSDAFQHEDYRSAAREAKMIRSGGEQVVVPYDAALYAQFLDAVLSGRVTKKLISTVGPICVQSYDRDGIRVHCQEAILYRRGAEIHTGIWVLLNGHESCYDDRTGLRFDDVDMFI